MIKFGGALWRNFGQGQAAGAHVPARDGSLTPIIVVAACYFLSGRLGLEFAIPPGYATAIWPASGIALAAVLLSGYRVWPGIFLGSFLVNIGTEFDTGSISSLSQSLAVPTVIAGGAALQAVGAGYLVRRFAGFPNALRTGSQILGLLVLGGMAGCLISASTGVGALVAFGRVPPLNAPYNWLTWWTGDTIGVFAFTPSILVLFLRPRGDRSELKRAVRVAGATAAGFAVCMGIMAYAIQVEQNGFTTRLAEKGGDLSASLKQVISSRLDTVGALEAFLAHAEDISFNEFRIFSAHLRSQVPGMLALEWVSHVPSARRGAFETWARGQGLPDFQITEQGAAALMPAGERPDYFPVTYIEPFPENRKALGFDLASKSERLAMLSWARDKGAIAISDIVTLVQGGMAVLAVAPVDRGAGPGPERQGQEWPPGFALGLVSVTEVTDTAFSAQDMSGIRFWLTDETAPSAPVVMASNSDEPPSAFRLAERGLFGAVATLEFKQPYELGGRRWVLHIVPTQEFVAANRSQYAWYLLAGGLLAASLIGAFTLEVTGREGELRTLVDARTREVNEANSVLREKDYLLSESQRVGHIGSWYAELPGRAVWSEETYRVYGVAPDSFTPTVESFMSLLHPDDRPAMQAWLAAATAGERPAPLEYRITRPDGSLRTLLGYGELERDSENKPRNLIGIVQDITERRQVEERLRESEAQFRRLVEQTPIPMVLVGQGGDFLLVNRKFTQTYGYRPEDVPNLDRWWALAYSDAAARAQSVAAWHRRTDAARARRSEIEPYEVRIVCKGGNTKIVSTFGVWVGDQILVVVEDITDRKNAEQALVAAREAAEKSNQAKSQFLTLMSHELRTPLNGIIGFAQLIDGEHFGRLSDKHKEFVDAILVSGRHLYDLINDILELSKIEAGRVTIELEEVDLVPLIKSVVANLQQSAAAAGIDLIAGNCGLGMPPIYTDRVRLAQCLFNLGSNAIKYNRPGGSVTFAYAREGERVRISIIDTGIGIPPDRQAELFQPFNRLGAEQKAIEGTGVGLALTRRLIELMGGRIGFTSTLGKGSRFWLDTQVFTARPDEGQPSAESTAPAQSQSSDFSVLYVEDNPSNLDLMRHVFSTREGVTLIEATNGAEGLAMARSQRPDLIILDIGLPDTNGIALLKRLKDLPEFAATPVMALSANAMPRDIREGLDAGFFAYITKPFDVAKFLATVDAALASVRRDREAHAVAGATEGGEGRHPPPGSGSI